MQWNQPPKKTVAPQPLCELAFAKAAHGTDLSDADLAKRCKRAEFDPRAPGDRQVSHESVKSLLDSFQKENLQTSGLFHFWDMLGEEEQQAPEQQQQQAADPRMDSYILVDVSSLKSLPHSAGFPVPTPLEVEALMRSLHLSGEERQMIERSTRGQASSSLWHKLRKGRLTSSRFGDILRSRGSPVSLLNQIMGYQEASPFMPPAVRWGRDNENKAQEAYLLLKSDINTVIEDTGLHLHSEFLFFGASADGKMIETLPDDSTNIGCLKIKCPFSISGKSILESTPEQLAKEYPDAFRLAAAAEDGKVHLRKNHRYVDSQ